MEERIFVVLCGAMAMWFLFLILGPTTALAGAMTGAAVSDVCYEIMVEE